ncbi:MAG: hypothetical protein Q9227_003723 [Pyrenula ochraceoflavens]
MPPDVRQEKERELAAVRLDIETGVEKKDRSAMIKRYHFVRFLEKQKAEKMLKRLTKEVSTLQEQLSHAVEEDHREKLNHKLMSAQEQAETALIDVKYAQYAPLCEQYISLYPKFQLRRRSRISRGNGNPRSLASEEPDQNEQAMQIKDKDPGSEKSAFTRDQKPALWHEVAKYTRAGTTGQKGLEMLRDRMVGSKQNDAAGARVESGGRSGHSKSAERIKRLSQRGLVTANDEENSDGGFFE